MPHFFIDASWNTGDHIAIRGSDARHIAQVLRLQEGDWIVLSDGSGRSFRATITKASPSKVEARIREELPRRLENASPVLALALIKGERFEWAIQKAVEIGCRRIIPFRSARTVPRMAEDPGDRKRARWQRIALEAAKQSGLPFHPMVDLPVDFSELVRKTDTWQHILFFYEGACSQDLCTSWDVESAAGSTDLLIIGPEGGFTDAEVDCAASAGAVTVSLGPQILRVETAAIVALAIWHHEKARHLLHPR